MPSSPPVGRVALLFTDIEGSTRLARAAAAAWPAALARHHDLVGGAIADCDGYVSATEGDAFFAVFADGERAARAALAAQRALRASDWPAELSGELKVRMGLHVGEVQYERTGYVGLEVHRAARVAAAAHGGQLLLTRPAVETAGAAIEAEPLGQHRLKDFPVPEPLFCARIDGRGADSFPPPRTLDLRPTNLPAGRPPLVGRDRDLERVGATLREARLTTLTGRGGAGKTSLALKAADAALDDHPGGVWWVTLATVMPEDALPTVASALRADSSRDEQVLDALVRRLEDRGRTLLVLDNLEHLPEIAGDVDLLLDRLPDVRILATSQAPLDLEREVLVPVESLAPPDALELFSVVTARARPERPLQRDEQADAEAVCARLDGLPLAIELAASRLAVLTPGQLRERLGASLDVVRGRGARPERQRSLEATLNWTLDLLDRDARDLFTRFGVFAGPVELEEIEAIAGDDVLDLVEVLLTYSLLNRVETGDGRVRFGLPESLRQLAVSRLAGSPGAKRWYRVHAERQLERSWPSRLSHMDTVAEHLGAADAEPEALLAIERVQHTAPQLAAALQTCVGVRLVNDGRHRDGLALVRRALSAEPRDPLVRSAALLGAGMAEMSRQPERARPALDAAVKLAEATDPVLAAAILAERSVLAISVGDLEQAVADAEAATALVEPHGGAPLAGALLMEAQAHQSAGDPTAATRSLDRCIEIAAQAGATAAWHEDSIGGDIAYIEGRPADAIPLYQRSLELAEQRHDGQQIAFDLIALAGCLADLGDDHGAATVVGILDAHCAAYGSDRDAMLPVSIGLDAALRAVDRTGHEVWEEGQAVPSGQRVVHACRLGDRALSATSSP